MNQVAPLYQQYLDAEDKSAFLAGLRQQNEILAQIALAGHVTPRGMEYPPVVAQLDALWHDVNNGLFGEQAKTGVFFTTISEVKAKYPKPTE